MEIKEGELAGEYAETLRRLDLANKRIAEREGLAAAAFVAGHKSTETAGRVYVSPQRESALRALQSLEEDANRDANRDAKPNLENVAIRKSSESLADAKGFEPPTSPSGGDGTKSRK